MRGPTGAVVWRFQPDKTREEGGGKSEENDEESDQHARDETHEQTSCTDLRAPLGRTLSRSEETQIDSFLIHYSSFSALFQRYLTHDCTGRDDL